MRRSMQDAGADRAAVDSTSQIAVSWLRLCLNCRRPEAVAERISRCLCASHDKTPSEAPAVAERTPECLPSVRNIAGACDVIKCFQPADLQCIRRQTGNVDCPKLHFVVRHSPRAQLCIGLSPAPVVAWRYLSHPFSPVRNLE